MLVTRAITLLSEILPKSLPHLIFCNNQNEKKNFKEHHDENSHHSSTDTGVSTESTEGSKPWKTVWDVQTGYVATKVLSKNTCIIAEMAKRVLLDKQLPASPQGHTGPRPHQFPPRGNRFIISRHRLQSLSPYGKLIQALCKGIPSYFAYPTAGEYTSNSALH
ncbi:GKN1 protein, partial [Zapornia atra]|nr:GKN1 protein [Zapornia atra]